MDPKFKPLSNLVWAWQFHHRLDALRRAYDAAREASDRDQKRYDEEWTELEANVAAGRATATQEDEDGQVIYDRGEHLVEMHSDSQSVVNLIREAFTISLNHLWERELTARMNVMDFKVAPGKDKPSKEELAFEFLKTEGIAPNELKLEQLRLVANVAKHSSGPSSSNLFKKWPEFFDVAEMERRAAAAIASGVSPKTPEAMAGYEYLKITDLMFDEFFEAVRMSGPKRR